MKSIADRLIESSKRTSVTEQDIARALRLPDRNHSDKFAPMVERFVFLQADNDIIADAARRAAASQMSCFEDMRPLLPEFWIEFDNCGFFFDGVWVWLCGRASKNVYCAGRARFIDLVSGSTSKIECSPFGARLDKDFLGSCFGHFLVLCALVCSPRACTREKVSPGRDLSPARRAMSFRKSQRLPLFSFNRMRVKRPDTSKRSSDVLECGAQTSKRGHWVIGHWRLIDGNPEPYWTWIEAHPRGDETAGFVAHERHVELAPGSFGTRRGCVIPTSPGQPGERRPAARL
jgi:hypothetical protein